MPASLSSDQRAFYQDNGYLHVKGLITPAEAAALRKEMHDLSARLGGKTNATWSTVRAEDPAKQTLLLHCHDVQFHSGLTSQLLLDPRFLAVATGLIGPNVQLHHTKMFIKPPERGSPFPMHQDQPYFPHEKHTMTAVIFHFDDAPIEKGCLRVVPGSYKLGSLPYVGADMSLDPKEYPIEKATPLPAKAGDAVFFNYLTIHGSGLNTSHEARTTLLIQFRDPSDKPLKDVHLSRGQGMMLAGIDPLAKAGHEGFGK